MRAVGVLVLLLIVSGRADAQVAAPVPTPYVMPVAAPDEAIVFEKPFYRGAWMRLKVGDELPNLLDTPGGNWDLRISSVKVGNEAVIVLYAAANFERWCLGLPGQALGGAGYYPDLTTIESANLQMGLNNTSRSLRVLGKDADLKKVCLPHKAKPKRVLK